MMNETAFFVILIFGGIGIYLLGQSLIDAYFRRKEKFVDNLNHKMKGKHNGS